MGTTGNLGRRRFLQLTAGVGAIAVVGAPRARAAAPRRGVWLAGDFHVHTTYSHDVWSGPGDDNTGLDEAYTLGWTPAQQIAIAESRGLDFVALTDHNRVEALRDKGYRSSRLVLVPGYEHSLSGGHAGVFVPTVDTLGDDILREVDGSTGFRGEDGLARFLGQVHERGGITVLNHPTSDGAYWANPVGAGTSSLGFDAVEAWNGRWQQRAETVPFSYSDNYKAVPWYEGNFLPHRRIGITGGSDNHWRSVTAVAGVGQPTTWVYARDRSPAAIIEAVRAGRTFVSAEPPLHQGPGLFLTAREDWAGGRSAMVGGEVAPLGPLVARLRVERGAGQRVRLVVGDGASGTVVKELLVTNVESVATVPVVIPPGGWLRAELLVDAGYLVTAVTSPIFAAADPAPVAVQRPPTLGAPVDYQTPPHTIPHDTCC